MSISNILKKNIPEYQKESPQLESYLDAAGEFLDGTKEAIVNIDNVYDYKNSTGFFFENTLQDRGYAVPSRIDEQTKRRVLRDLAELHRKNGTLDGIIHAVRMAGLTPEIRVGWLPSPRAIRRGAIIDPVSLIESRYDITRYVYTDMLYGEAVSTPDGVFFEGYRYEDTLNENKIGPLAILGERYATTPSNPVPVAKTPYIIVKFEENNKTIVTDPVTDPETGEVFEYSLSEEFQLINDALKYFLVQNNRPTTMRVIIIVSLQPFFEEIDITDEFEHTATYNPDGNDDLDDEISPTEEVVIAGIIDASDIVIGSNVLIGMKTPYTSRFFVIEQLVIGEDYTNRIETASSTIVTGSTFHLSGNDVYEIPLRMACEFTFTPPIDVDVYGYKGTDSGTKTLLVSVTSGVEEVISPSLEYDVIRFEYSAVLADDVTVDYVFDAFDRT